MAPRYVFFNLALAAAWFVLNGELGELLYDLPFQLVEYGRISFKYEKMPGFSGNFFFKIVNPAVYLAVSAAVAQRLLPPGYAASLYLFIPAFWLMRAGFMVLKNSFAFLNLRYELQALVLSFVLGEGAFFWIIRPLLADNESVWITPGALRDALWVAILAYIAKVLWDVLKRQYTSENLYPADRRRDIALRRYEKFRKKYGDYIDGAVSECGADRLAGNDRTKLTRLIYAVMIYEDYNRPWAYRAVEYVLKATVRRDSRMSLGIMQVESYRRLSNLDSIDGGVKILSAPFLDGSEDPVSSAILSYNRGADYLDEVQGIYEMLQDALPLEDAVPAEP